MSEAQQLLRLQGIDSEIMQKKQRLGEVLKAQKETEELRAARERAASAAAELKTWEARYNDLNLELDSLNNKTKRSEDRLYSGRVTNPKELTDLQNEIASLGRRRQPLEDEILEAMITIEETETEVNSAREALIDIEAQWQRAQAELKSEQDELAQRLTVLSEARLAQLPLIPASALKRYESIAKRHGGLAVVVLRENRCQGCQLNVSANTVKAVKQGGLVLCENCDRILTEQW